MKEKRLLALALAVLILGCAWQAAFAQTDSLRQELVRSRAFIRAAETQLTKTLELYDRLPAADTVEVVRVDTVLRTDTVTVEIIVRDTTWMVDTVYVEVPTSPEPPAEPEDPPAEEPDDSEEPGDTIGAEIPPMPEDGEYRPDLAGDGFTSLPRSRAWHRAIVDWIGTLKLEDVALSPSVPVADGTVYPGIEDVWAGQLKGVTNPTFPAWTMKAQAESFLLSEIEADTVLYNRFPNGAAWWYNASIKTKNGGEGNPYFGSAALCNRVLVSVAVDMMMSDYWHDAGRNPWGTSVWAKPDSRFLGGLMNAWTYAYGVCKDHASPEARAGFERGLIRMAEKLAAQKPGRNTPNMSTRVVSAMAHLYNAVPSARELALKVAREYMFGPGQHIDSVVTNRLFYNAGYVQEGYSPETTYQGVSLYHLTEARAVTYGDPAWDFMDEPLRRMCDFRSHQLYPDPLGNVIGPSAYAGRTGAGWEKLQASHEWRDLTLAALYPECAPFPVAVATPQGMANKLQATFRSGSRMESHFLEVGTRGPSKFQIDHDHHWVSYVPYTPYPSWSDVARSRSDKRLPVQKDTAYSRVFAGDFWAYKGHGFSFFVESEADGGTYGGYRGGSLQAFYTPQTGPVILGRKNKESRQVAEIETWATHHVWNGSRSTALEDERSVVYSGGAVTVSGGETNVVSRFTALSNGIQIEHEAPGNWTASLPIHEPASITCIDGDLTACRVVRVERAGGAVFVTYSKPVALRFADFQQTYQASTRIRVMHAAFQDSITIRITV